MKSFFLFFLTLHAGASQLLSPAQSTKNSLSSKTLRRRPREPSGESAVSAPISFSGPKLAAVAGKSLLKRTKCAIYVIFAANTSPSPPRTSTLDELKVNTSQNFCFLIYYIYIYIYISL